MSLHASLRIDPTRTRHRNVLKRHERIQRLIEWEKWNDRESAFGLPKVKSLKIKVKKIKEEKAEGGTAPTATPSASPGAAPAAGSEKKKAAPAAEKKPAEKKSPEKK